LRTVESRKWKRCVIYFALTPYRQNGPNLLPDGKQFNWD